MNRGLKIVCFVFAAFTISADCGSDDLSPVNTEDVSNVTQQDASTAQNDASICIGSLPNEDSDQDNLIDLLEDANQNCHVDPDETDPFLSDSDGDGLMDGEEDIDQNGVWNEFRGEFDPRNPDTNGDGVFDGEELAATVCISENFIRLPQTQISLGNTFTAFINGSLIGRTTNVDGGILINDEQDALAILLPNLEQMECRYEDFVEASIFSENEIIDRSSSVEENEWQDIFHLRLGNENFANMLESFLANLDVEITWNSVPSVIIDDLWLEVRGKGVFGNTQDGLTITFASPYAQDWTSSVRLSSLYLSQRERPRSMCETLVTQTGELLDLVVALNMDPSHEIARIKLLADIDDMITRRRAQNQETRLWIVLADAHIEGVTGALLNEEPFSNIDELEPFISTTVTENSDQRIWSNAVAAVSRLRDLLEPSKMLLVVMADEEDTQFRESTLEYPDGDPSANPLQIDSEERNSLISHYVERFRSLDVPIIAVSSARSGDCNIPTESAVNLGSFWQIPVETNGSFVNSCANPNTLEEKLHHLGRTGQILQFSEPVAANTLRFETNATMLTPLILRWIDPQTVLLDGTLDGDWSVSYVFFDPN